MIISIFENFILSSSYIRRSKRPVIYFLCLVEHKRARKWSFWPNRVNMTRKAAIVSFFWIAAWRLSLCYHSKSATRWSRNWEYSCYIVGSLLSHHPIGSGFKTRSTLNFNLVQDIVAKIHTMVDHHAIETNDSSSKLFHFIIPKENFNKTRIRSQL